MHWVKVKMVLQLVLLNQKNLFSLYRKKSSLMHTIPNVLFLSEKSKKCILMYRVTKQVWIEITKPFQKIYQNSGQITVTILLLQKSFGKICIFDQKSCI